MANRLAGASLAGYGTPVTYRSEIKIRFGDEDHAGIVYFPRFFDFFHQVFEDFFADEGGRSYRQVLDEDHCGWPSVHAEADFRKPIRFGDVLRIELDVEAIGKSSATFLYRGRLEGGDGVEIVQGRVTVVCIDMRTFESRPIPDFYRRLFERHLTG